MLLMVVILQCESETLTLDSGVLHALQHVLQDEVKTCSQTSCQGGENLRESLGGGRSVVEVVKQNKTKQKAC